MKRMDEEEFARKIELIVDQANRKVFALVKRMAGVDPIWDAKAREGKFRLELGKYEDVVSRSADRLVQSGGWLLDQVRPVKRGRTMKQKLRKALGYTTYP